DEGSVAPIVYDPTIISARPGPDEGGDRADARAGEPAIAFREPPHLRDQVALYESFQYHSLPFAQAELEVARALARDGVAPQSRRDVRRVLARVDRPERAPPARLAGGGAGGVPAVLRADRRRDPGGGPYGAQPR